MANKDTKRVGAKKQADIRRKLTKLTDKLIELYSTDDTIMELMLLRGYNDITMYEMLKEVGVFRVDTLSDIKLIAGMIDDEDYDNTFYELSGLDVQGSFILSGRYVVPIRDIKGEVTALVGYYKDYKKYITTSTYGFSKAGQFFNVECYKDCWERNNGVVYVVEGIYDALTLRSLGLSSLAVMGNKLEPVKQEMLKRYRKVIVIPDNDETGRATNPYGGFKDNGKVWRLPRNCCVIQLPQGIKDIDELVKGYDCIDDLKAAESRVGLYKLQIGIAD